ncbi:MAG: hypothetical protein KGM42_05015 [Hyphomicrobiales bacterium]|nr:hypothetical protein [Hyphomicrobiales bacterium]
MKTLSTFQLAALLDASLAMCAGLRKADFTQAQRFSKSLISMVPGAASKIAPILLI